MKEVKLEEAIENYFSGNRLMGAIEGLPRAATGAIQIPPCELLKAASWSSQIIELYSKEVFSLNPSLKYTVSDYFECFNRSLKLVMSTKEEKIEKHKEYEDEQIKLMMFLMMTGLPKFDYELYGFQCQTTQTSNFTEKDYDEEEVNESQEGEDEYSSEVHDNNEEVPKRIKNQRPETEKTEKDSPSEDRSSEKISDNEERSKMIRKPGRPRKRKYHFSKKTE